MGQNGRKNKSVRLFLLMRLSPQQETASNMAIAFTDQFNKLYEQYREPIRRLCIGYENDTRKAEELCQEVWAALWDSLTIYKGQCSERTWVYRVAHNVAIRHVTKAAKHPKWVSLDETNESSNLDPTLIYQHRNMIEKLKVLLGKIKPTDRQIILLFLEGFEHQEISDISGLTPDNVAQKISRIKKILSMALTKKGGL
jgi:RNA polymerase sigma-70 factor, ECF subfamily